MIKEKILRGETFLGIELGSTRIKACLIDNTFAPIASGGFEWENKFENGYWTYDIEDIRRGVRACFADLQRDVSEKYGVFIKKLSSIGISGMMHGYLVFDKDDNILVPFRTWRNTTTAASAEELSKLFNFNIPQRWSIAHLYQAILNSEDHISKIARITTVSGYIHYLLTGKWETGIDEGSGMFPLNGEDYDENMVKAFDQLIANKNLPWKMRDIFPKIRPCYDNSTYLTESGAAFLDPTGSLEAGIPVCAPEGDAGTGMIATNSIKPRTGNISAGTSVFLLLVLEKQLRGMYPEIDVVMTPDAFPVALIHSNNGCSELDLWVKMFGEFASLAGTEISKSDLYKLLYENALNGDSDCGKVITYNFLANEPVAGVEKGKPLFFRTSDSNLNLANFFRSQIYSALAVLKLGMNILTENENVTADSFTAHGGLFKVRSVAPQLLANTLDTEISVSDTAGEGGAFGMALLAAYMVKGSGASLSSWLDEKVFANCATEISYPEKSEREGFDNYFTLYKSALRAIDQF